MDILQQLEQIARERELSLDELLREIEESLAVAYKKFVGAAGEVMVHFDPRKGDPTKGLTAQLEKEVVGVVTEPSLQISLDDARKKDPEVQIGDFFATEVDPNRFGRIAAATFKQVLNTKLRDAEKRQINEIFQDSIGQIVTGVVTRNEEDGSAFLQVNKVEVELPFHEKVGTERYRRNDQFRVYVLKVDDSPRRMRVLVSRTHPGLLRKLFELEVPEIADGLIEIVNAVREPGQRSKISVRTNDIRVDAVGACVGPRGARVQAVVDELNDEKVDIVPFDEDPRTYIINALNPAKVNTLKLNAEEKSAYCVVPDNQLSLAIGKSGQNVRLAVRLTGWKIDIKSEAKVAEGKKA